MRTAVGRPLLIAMPSRVAGLARPRARLFLALLALLMLASLTALSNPSLQSAATPNDDPASTIAYGATVEALRHGANYYSATVDALRASDQPVRPWLAVRLPTLSVVQASLSPVTAALLLYALALVTLASWWKCLGSILPRPIPRLVAVVFAAGGMWSALLGQHVIDHELWAGLLISLSLATRAPDRSTASVALGLSAMLLHEGAALFVIIMAVCALSEGFRREAACWGIAAAVFGITLWFHAGAVAAITGPLDQPWSGWPGILGFGFAVRSLVGTTILSALPLSLGALAIGLALAGWASWRDPLAFRALATLIGYLLFLSLLAPVDASGWAYLIAPISMIGLIFVPDALRDLVRAALDRRRITVTRTAP
jgi:hypothetical protein